MFNFPRFMAVLLALHFAAFADDPPKPVADAAKPAEEKEKDKDKSDSHEKVVVTTNSVVVGGKKIDYLARAGTLVLKDNEDKPTAAISL